MELQAEARQRLGFDVQKMYSEGVWTGMLNALDPSSPHCVQSEEEALEWRDKARLYLNSVSASYFANGNR